MDTRTARTFLHKIASRAYEDGQRIILSECLSISSGGLIYGYEKTDTCKFIEKLKLPEEELTELLVEGKTLDIIKEYII